MFCGKRTPSSTTIPKSSKFLSIEIEDDTNIIGDPTSSTWILQKLQERGRHSHWWVAQLRDGKDVPEEGDFAQLNDTYLRAKDGFERYEFRTDPTERHIVAEVSPSEDNGDLRLYDSDETLPERIGCFTHL